MGELCSTIKDFEMSKRAKIHHYVPKVAQRRFCFRENKIWYVEKDTSGVFGEPEERNINSTFQKRDYYTVLEGDLPSDKVEVGFYGSLDNYWGSFLAEVERIFLRGSVPIIEGEPLETLQEAVFHFVKRTPEFISNLHDTQDDYSIGRELVDNVSSAMRGANYSLEDVDAYVSKFEKSHQVIHQGRTVRVKATIPISDKIRSSLRGFKARWGIISSKHSIILPNCFVYRIGNGGKNGLANPNLEFWIPVSPKRVLVLVRDEGGHLPYLSDIGRDQVRQMNLFALRSNQAVASHSRKLLESLLKVDGCYDHSQHKR